VPTTSGFQFLFQLQGEKIGVCLLLQFPGAEVVGQTRSSPLSGSVIPKNSQLLLKSCGLALAQRRELSGRRAWDLLRSRSSSSHGEP
jgi:hypothetical protein